VQIREAKIDEIDALNKFICASKGHWGYTEKFLDEFIARWRLNKKYFEKNSVQIIENSNEIIGIFSFSLEGNNEVELDLFFINSCMIGKGFGKIMWEKCIEYAALRGWKSFKLIADPNSEPFYLRMGAKTITNFESFPGRFVPIMRYQMSNERA
jgi:N-acetylglutamate synthase-like GNAT family acetyltransferase